MSSQDRRAKKHEFIKKLFERLSTHKQIIVVGLMNVGANQVQSIRQQLFKRRGELFIGKNTVMRKAIDLRREPLDEHNPDYQYFKRFGAPIPTLDKLSDLCKGKIGLIFTDEPVFELKPIIEGNKVQTAAKVGTLAPTEVVIPAGPTGLDPSQISFFHALQISTKIQKGQIEIVKDFKVCEKGRMVGSSEATLLQKLAIKPFLYGMTVLAVYDDGSVLTPEVVGLSPADIISKFQKGVSNITGLSLALNMPTELALPHMIANAFKNIAAISVSTDYKIKQLENMSTAPAPSKEQKKEEKKAEVKEEKPKEEEEPAVEMGDLFGGF